MPARLLSTKLHAPTPRAGAVTRPRLLAELDATTSARLTLVSAPPGFGKSSLLADWMAAGAGTSEVAWISLDPSDDDPSTFWAYVLAALERAADGLGARSAEVLPPPAAIADDLLTPVLNDIAVRGLALTLVLDDYHVITRQEIHDDVGFLIDHLPANLHVVISTRADPPLSLPRLRARGELVEIRAADLRFRADEAAAYLNGSMGLGLASDDLAALDDRTEGWIAALQLVALSVRGRSDAGAFIRAFAGDDRYVVDYLVEEVLARQTEAVRSFLLRTSILDRLSGPLCDALTGRTDGRETLAALDRANLFLIALDDRRRWYRYHHLFADVLRARLGDAHADLVPELHRRASAWLEEDGDRPAAVEHALAGGDVEHAADLIELAAPDFQVTRQDATLRRWLDALPDATFERRPVLAMTHVAALLTTGTIAGVDARLATAERWVSAARDEHERADADAAGMTVRREDALAGLPASVALHRAGLARMRGDDEEAIRQARRALEVAGPDQPLERGGASGILGLALWTGGDLAAAETAWSEAATELHRAGRNADILGVSIALGDIRMGRGELDAARRTFEAGVRLGSAQEHPLRGTADMHVGLAEVALERHELGPAAAHLEVAEALGDRLGLPQFPYRRRVAAARLRQAQGDPAGALELLDEASTVYDADFFPDVRPIRAVRARIDVAEGRLSDARAWASAAEVAPDDGLDYLHAYQHATLARLVLAEAVRDERPAVAERASDLAERLVEAATTGGWTWNAVDALVVLAVARRELRDRGRSVAALERALALAEPGGFARTFVTEGPPLTALLGEVRPTPFVRRLLGLASGSVRPAVSTQPLAEALSARELEVLRLLQGELDGPDLARELGISLNTLRTHTRNVYAKLQVTNRRAAVRRAGELGLLSAEGSR